METSMTEQGEEYRDDLSRGLPVKVAELREKLRRKAKSEKQYRFYSLYGHLSRPVVLEAAWRQVKSNGGAAGVDGIKIKDITRDEEGERAFLENIREELESKSYRPKMVKRVYIPKANGKKRPLGIPTVKDRVVQTALLLLLEPIFESDFEECSYGFRPGRCAHDALDCICKAVRAGRCCVYDADLEGYFDSIPHDKLMACLRMRIVDSAVLKLIKLWLQAPVKEEGKGGNPPTVKRSKQGTPQGGVISPLLANLYLHWFDKLFHRKDGPACWAGATLVRYADDFVVLARYIGPQLQEYIETQIEQWLHLKINREKTRIVDVTQPGQTLDFLGYSLRREKDRFGRNSHYWRLYPSRKSMSRERDWLRAMTGPDQCFTPVSQLIERVNVHLKGWSNYYGKGHSRRELRQINCFVRARLTRHLKRRSQRGWKRPDGISAYQYLNELGLIYL